MTDREKLIALLNEFGVEWTAEPVGRQASNASVILESGSRKVDGYSLFFAEWAFTPEGEFIDVGVWE